LDSAAIQISPGLAVFLSFGNLANGLMMNRKITGIGDKTQFVGSLVQFIGHRNHGILENGYHRIQYDFLKPPAAI